MERAAIVMGGDIMGIDPELVIPNTGLSVYEECIAPERTENE